MPPAALFDPIARVYDEQFGGMLGQLYRHATWRWLDSAFQPGDRVLEMACGTGEDAIHLAGRGVRILCTDPSSAMLEVARKKILAEDLGDRIELRQLAIEELSALEGEIVGGFTGAFSSFGGFNLVADLTAAARRIAALVRPGGRLVLSLMGRYSPWEWLWYLSQGQPSKAFRRLAPGGAGWRGVKVYYPSIGTVRRAFKRDFRLVRAGGLGVLLPPPYTEDWAQNHAQLIAGLDRWERRIESWPLVPSLGDHYVMELLRK